MAKATQAKKGQDAQLWNSLTNTLLELSAKQIKTKTVHKRSSSLRGRRVAHLKRDILPVK